MVPSAFGVAVNPVTCPGTGRCGVARTVFEAPDSGPGPTAVTVNSYSSSLVSKPAVIVQQVVIGRGSLVKSGSSSLTLRW